MAVTHGLNGDGKKGFQLPVRLSGGIANLQLYVLNDKALQQDGAKILLSLDTANLGIVTAYFSVTRGVLDIVVTASKDSAVKSLEACRSYLQGLLTESGFVLGDFAVAIDTQSALETSLPPDAIEEWAANSPDIMAQTAYDYKV